MNFGILRAELLAWYREHGRDLPWRRTVDPYAILVSELMLQQTQVVTVIPYFERWLARFPDFAALAGATEEEVLHVWQGLGYYSRARNLQRAAQLVVAEYGGTLPNELAAIARLPGVGRYTAGAVASFAFDAVTPAVDANIARVIARLFNLQLEIDSSAGVAALWRAAEEMLPKKGGRAHNSALMELGALVCVPRKPNCPQCPVRQQCQSTDPGPLPLKKPRRARVELEENCGWIFDGRRLLLEQQTGARWRGLWKLPLLEGAVGPGRALLELEYPFTHHRVTLRVYPAEAPVRADLRWFALEELAGAAFAAAHLRAIRMLLGSGRPVLARARRTQRN